MAWRIHSWSPQDHIGEVVSPHYGPWSFGASENPTDIADFQVGEEVVVEIGAVTNDVAPVLSVARPRTRHDDMPSGTRCAVFDSLNAGPPDDMVIEEHVGDRLHLWLYDCCTQCGGPGHDVVFEGVSFVAGLDADLDEPWFRLATKEETDEYGAQVPDDSLAYTIVLEPSLDNHNVFVVARSVVVRVRMGD